ncbi:hypothetical protein M3Y95_01248000 [Aphelenchoides besseyi]|nr:hypothetical protein M3Y95_01248000 [Aphelenchoides besseyi]
MFLLFVLLFIAGTNAEPLDKITLPLDFQLGYTITTIKVGTPPVDYTVGLKINQINAAFLDTPMAQNESKKAYDSSQSSTSNVTKVGCSILLEFEEQQTGNLVTDILNINGTQISNFLFCNTHGAFYYTRTFADVPVDAIFTLGLEREGFLTTVKPLLQQFANPEFTLYFNKNAKNRTDIQKNVGQLTLGGRDTINCNGNFKSFPLAEPQGAFWSVKTISITFNQQDFYLKENDGLTRFVIFEHSSDFIMVPDNVRQAIYSYYYVKDEWSLTVHCDRARKGPWITVQIAGISYFIKPTDYVDGFESGKCKLLVAPLYFFGEDSIAFSTDLVLGMPFFRSYCVNFNLADMTIGFANHK